MQSCSEVLRCANALLGYSCYNWQHIVGLEALANAPVQTRRQIIVLVGDIETPWFPSEPTKSLLRAKLNQAAHVCVIGGGAFIPAMVGTHKSQKIASHSNFRPALAELVPFENMSDQPIVHSRSISSAVSGMVGPQMILELVTHQQGEFTGQALAEYLGMGAAKTEASSTLHWRYLKQARGDRNVSDALAVMANSIEQKLSIGDIAEETCVSPRQLERSFKTLLEISPSAAYRNLRLDLARKLLCQTRLSLSEISVASGFSGTANLSKWFKSKYGQLPCEAREQAYSTNHLGPDQRAL